MMKNTITGGFEGFWAKYSEWYQFPEMVSDNLIARRMGVPHKEPLFWVDEQRAVITFEIEKRWVSTDDLCDHQRARRHFDPLLAIDAKGQ